MLAQFFLQHRLVQRLKIADFCCGFVDGGRLATGNLNSDSLLGAFNYYGKKKREVGGLVESLQRSCEKG